jgi:branched-subunit amino acid ABC-type transport system permease component
MAEKQQWSDLTPWQQKAIVVGGAVELVLTAVALRDLVKRPSSQVRGPKALWAMSFVVQPVGPLAYLCVARR